MPKKKARGRRPIAIDRSSDEGRMGARLRQLRTQHGLTIEQVSERTGVPTGVVSTYEREGPKQVGQLRLLAALYGASLDWIVNGEHRDG